MLTAIRDYLRHVIVLSLFVALAMVWIGLLVSWAMS